MFKNKKITYALIFNFYFEPHSCVCEALWWLKNTFWKVESIILPVLVKEYNIPNFTTNIACLCLSRKKIDCREKLKERHPRGCYNL